MGHIFGHAEVLNDVSVAGHFVWCDGFDMSFSPRGVRSDYPKKSENTYQLPFCPPASRFLVWKTQKSTPTFTGPSAIPKRIDWRKIEIPLPQHLSSSSWPYWMSTIGK